MTDIAVNSEENAEITRVSHHAKQDLVMFERFDASHGSSNIKSNAYDARQDIRVKTWRYLKEQETKALLLEVELAVATDYLNNQTGAARNTQAIDSAIGD